MRLPENSGFSVPLTWMWAVPRRLDRCASVLWTKRAAESATVGQSEFWAGPGARAGPRTWVGSRQVQVPPYFRVISIC